MLIRHHIHLSQPKLLIFRRHLNPTTLVTMTLTKKSLFHYVVSPGAPVAFKTWWGHQYMVGIICPHPSPGWNRVLKSWRPKLGVDTSPRPHAHRRARLYLFHGNSGYISFHLCKSRSNFLKVPLSKFSGL